MKEKRDVEDDGVKRTLVSSMAQSAIHLVFAYPPVGLLWSLQANLQMIAV